MFTGNTENYGFWSFVVDFTSISIKHDKTKSIRKGLVDVFKHEPQEIHMSHRQKCLLQMVRWEPVGIPQKRSKPEEFVSENLPMYPKGSLCGNQVCLESLYLVPWFCHYILELLEPPFKKSLGIFYMCNLHFLDDFPTFFPRNLHFSRVSHCNLHDFPCPDLADHLDTIVLVWVAQNQPRPQATLPMLVGFKTRHWKSRNTLWWTNITMENHHFQWVNPL